MEINAAEWPVVRMAVMQKDGTVEYRQMPVKPETSENSKGEVIYPFKRTPISSEGWRASDHVRLIARDDEED